MNHDDLPPYTIRESLAAMILEHDAGGITLPTLRAARAAIAAAAPAQPAEPVAWHNPRADKLRAALRDIADTKNLTATSAQFARHLQKVACDALTLDAMAEPQSAAPAQPAEPGAWQYKHVDAEAWDIVRPDWRIGQTTKQKIDELRSFRYEGNPCYEVRALYAVPPPQPLTLSDEQVWNSKEIMAINARAGLQMPVLMELARAMLAAAQEKAK